MSPFRTIKLWLKGAEQQTNIKEARREVISVGEILNRCDPEKWSEPVRQTLAAINNEADSQAARLQAAHQLFKKVFKDKPARQHVLFSTLPHQKPRRTKHRLEAEQPNPFPFYSFRLETIDHKILKPQPPDPDEVPLSFYRIREAQKAMEFIEEGNVVIVPGFTGTGKSKNFRRAVTRLARGKGMPVKYIEEFKELMQEPRHYDDDPLLDPDIIPDNSLIILDECSLSLRYDSEGHLEKFTQLREMFSQLLARGVSLIFMGGGWWATEDQIKRISEIAGKKLGIDSILFEIIPLEPKPLSGPQIEEFLFVGQHNIKPIEQRFYASIVRRFIPPYLRALFLFRIKEKERTMEELLDRVEKDVGSAGLSVAIKTEARIQVADTTLALVKARLMGELRRHLEILQRPKGW